MIVTTKPKTLRPMSEQELSEMITSDGPFVIRGGGSRSPAGPIDTVLETTGMSGVVLYEPGAQTIIVRAGTTLSELHAVLAAQKQRLAFEPPQCQGLHGRGEDSTIGGIVADNTSGPRRIAVGACRDFCLGVRFVDGTGRVMKNGGRVMKNVTGYDLVKLMAGSQGTLGVITEVTLKTQPIPEKSLTLTLDGLTDADAVAAMSAALGTSNDVTGAAHFPALNGEAPQTHFRLEGFESSVRYRGSELQKALSQFGTLTENLDPTANADTWRAVRDLERFHGEVGDIWRVSLKPSDAPNFVAAVGALDAFYDWGGGLVWLRTSSGTDVRQHLPNGFATLERASDKTLARFGRFQPETAGVARLSEGLRRQFDPEQKFNRGTKV